MAERDQDGADHVVGVVGTTTRPGWRSASENSAVQLSDSISATG
jgi:hypothetical protein